MAEPDTPLEEWKRSKTGREYTVLQGPGGGTVFRQGTESPDEARLRRSIELEAKRARQAKGEPEPEKPRPKGKGRRKDPTPGAKAKAAQDAQAGAQQVKTGKAKASRDQLAAAAELPLAVLGAFVGYQVLDCAWCADSMRRNAGPAAKDIAKTTNPYLLNLLYWWHGLMAAFAGGDGLTQFLAPPLIHHALPGPAADFVSPFMGVPPRKPKPRPHAHAAGPARAETQGPVPGPQSASPGPPPMPPAQAAAPAGSPVQTMTPEQAAMLAQAQTALQDAEARLAAQQAIGARQAAMAGHNHGPNIPTYRAADSMPTGPYAAMAARQQQAAAEAAAGAASGLPNYTGENGGVGPVPPPVAGDQGSPLPPEAGV